MLNARYLTSKSYLEERARCCIYSRICPHIFFSFPLGIFAWTQTDINQKIFIIVYDKARCVIWFVFDLYLILYLNYPQNGYSFFYGRANIWRWRLPISKSWLICIDSRNQNSFEMKHPICWNCCGIYKQSSQTRLYTFLFSSFIVHTIASACNTWLVCWKYDGCKLRSQTALCAILFSSFPLYLKYLVYVYKYMNIKIYEHKDLDSTSSSVSFRLIAHWQG